MNGMNKILLVSNMYPSKGFPSYGVFVKNFCDQLSSVGVDFDTSVLTKTANPAVKALKYALFYGKTFFRCWLGSYPLVYIHYPSFSAAPVNLARKLRKFEIVTNVHGTDVVPLKREHEEMLHNTETAVRNSRLVVVPSLYYKKLVTERYGLPEERVFVYPSGGIDERVFHAFDESSIRRKKAELGIEEADFVIGFVGRITRAKGWDVFLDALEQSGAAMTEKCRVILVGSGEDDELLEKRIAGLPEDLREKILRFPLLDQRELAGIYNVLDVFVFPTMSASESLGLVAIEAMACGVPVLASDYAAPAYYVEDGVNGYKFEKGNAAALAAAIDRLRNNPGEMPGLRKGALETAEQYGTAATRQLLETMLKLALEEP